MVFGIMVTDSVMRNRLFDCYCKLVRVFGVFWCVFLYRGRKTAGLTFEKICDKLSAYLNGCDEDPVLLYMPREAPLCCDGAASLNRATPLPSRGLEIARRVRPLPRQ